MLLCLSDIAIRGGGECIVNVDQGSDCSHGLNLYGKFETRTKIFEDDVSLRKISAAFVK